MNNTKYHKTKKGNDRAKLCVEHSIHKYIWRLTITMTVSSLFTKDRDAIVSAWLQSKRELHHWPLLPERQYHQDSYGKAGVCDSSKGPGSVSAVVLLLKMKCASIPAKVCASCWVPAIDCEEWKFSRQLTKLHSCHYQYFQMMKN